METMLSRFTVVSQVPSKRFYRFFEIKPNITQNQNAAFPNPIKTGFVFENVGFQYRNTDRWANRNLSFTFNPEKNWLW
jgi:ATP-binding cassette subfamily B protein